MNVALIRRTYLERSKPILYWNKSRNPLQIHHRQKLFNLVSNEGHFSRLERRGSERIMSYHLSHLIQLHHRLRFLTLFRLNWVFWDPTETNLSIILRIYLSWTGSTYGTLVFGPAFGVKKTPGPVKRDYFLDLLWGSIGEHIWFGPVRFEC